MIPFATCILCSKMKLRKCVTSNSTPQVSIFVIPDEVNRSSPSTTPHRCCPGTDKIRVHLQKDCSNDVTLKRKRKVTSSLHIQSMKDPMGLLDKTYFSSAQHQLNLRLHHWNINIFALETFTSGNVMVVLGCQLFEHYGLIKTFQLKPEKLIKTFRMVENAYHAKNPYHNIIHAADVTQAMHCFLNDGKLKHSMSAMETMCALISAMCHDADHPGVNQSFLEKTNHYLMVFYGTTSALENHHWRMALSIAQSSGIFDHFTRSQWDSLRRLISQVVLATDISKQESFIASFSDLIEQKIDFAQNDDAKLLVMQMAMKCADIGNPARPWALCTTWASRVCDEFFNQGDREREMNCQPISFPMDRYASTRPQIQIGFIKFLVMPLFAVWHKFMQTQLSNRLCQQIKENLSNWESLADTAVIQKQPLSIADKENHFAKSTQTVHHCSPHVYTSNVSGSSSVVSLVVTDLEPLHEEESDARRPLPAHVLSDRRGSLPVSLSQTESSYLRSDGISHSPAACCPSNTSGRRQSLGLSRLANISGTGSTKRSPHIPPVHPYSSSRNGSSNNSGYKRRGSLPNSLQNNEPSVIVTSSSTQKLSTFLDLCNAQFINYLVPSDKYVSQRRGSAPLLGCRQSKTPSPTSNRLNVTSGSRGRITVGARSDPISPSMIAINDKCRQRSFSVELGNCRYSLDYVQTNNTASNDSWDEQTHYLINSVT